MLRIYDFNDKSGEVLIQQGGNLFVLDMYGEDKCNTFIATTWNKQLQWFFMDESHGKRMLGLTKNFQGERENCLQEVMKITIYKNKCANWKKIVNLFAQAFDELTIEIKEG